MDRLRHINKAIHNEEYFNSFNINNTKFRDWIVVGIFYAALHYYEAYFAYLGKHSRDHGIYDEWIPNNARIKNTYLDYRELKQYRWHATYRFMNFTPGEIQNNILPKFNIIKNHILNLNP